MAQEVSYIIRARDAYSAMHKGADKAVDRTAQNLKRASGVMVIATGAVSASLFAMVKTTANSADHLSKLEARLGISAEGFSSLAHAAEMSDISMSTLEMSMQRQTRRLSEAAQGTGQAVAALDSLGLSAKALKDMKPEEAFMKIAAEMEKVPSKADRARIAMQLWDTEGVKLNQMIAEGTENIEALRERAELLGLTFDSQTAAASARLNDEISDLGNMAIGVKNTFSKDLIPFFGEFAGLINESLMEIKKSGDLDKWAADMAEGVITAFSATAEVAINMPTVWHASMVSVKTIAADGVAIIDTVLLGVEKFYGVMALLPGTIGQPYQMAAADISEMRESLSDIGTDLLISADASSTAGEEWAIWALKAQSSIDAVRNKVIEDAVLATEIKAEGHLAEEEAARVHESNLTDISTKEAAKRAQAEQRVQLQIMNMRFTVANQAIGLIRTLGGNSKKAAIAAIALEKGLAIARTVMNTEAAAINAMASLPYPANLAAAAQVRTMGAISIGIIGATGLAQAASVGSGGASAGSPGGEPTRTQEAATSLIGADTSTQIAAQDITIVIKGEVVTAETIDKLVEPIVDGINRGGLERNIKIDVEALAV